MRDLAGAALEADGVVPLSEDARLRLAPAAGAGQDDAGLDDDARLDDDEERPPSSTCSPAPRAATSSGTRSSRPGPGRRRDARSWSWRPRPAARAWAARSWRRCSPSAARCPCRSGRTATWSRRGGSRSGSGSPASANCRQLRRPARPAAPGTLAARRRPRAHVRPRPGRGGVAGVERPRVRHPPRAGELDASGTSCSASRRRGSTPTASSSPSAASGSSGSTGRRSRTRRHRTALGEVYVLGRRPGRGGTRPRVPR